MIGGSNVLGSTVLASSEAGAPLVGVVVLIEGACGANINCPVTTGNVLDELVEGTLTLGDAIRLMLAVSAGKTLVSGSLAASTISFRNTLDDKTRVLADVNANGERTVVSLDPSQ
jgi:hypothetical protein